MAKLKYHDSIAAAVADLGRPEEIGKTFAVFQRYLYQAALFFCILGDRLNVLMKPADALDRQISRYRRMTGEERLDLALRLHELSCDVAREEIRGGLEDILGGSIQLKKHRSGIRTLTRFAGLGMKFIFAQNS